MAAKEWRGVGRNRWTDSCGTEPDDEPIDLRSNRMPFTAQDTWRYFTDGTDPADVDHLPLLTDE